MQTQTPHSEQISALPGEPARSRAHATAHAGTDGAETVMDAPTPRDAAQDGARPAERPLKPALLHGWRGRCPNCGSGPMLKGYLKVRDTCPVCAQELHHHRADDGPAYLTILLVGHIMAPMLHLAFTHLRPDPLILATSFSIGCVALSLYLLPRLKGAMVGLQWAKRMHGFAAPQAAG